MKKQSFYKDFLRTIYKSKARFLSIMVIIAIGVGFYAGINATEPDMILSADKYYKQNSLSDFRIVAPLGFKEEDIKNVEETKGIREVQKGYSKDTFLSSDKGNTSIVRAFSYNAEYYKGSSGLNIPTVLDGRMPVKSGEIVMERGHSVPSEIKIGSKVVLSVPDKEDLSKFLARNTYTVVGFVESPLYIDFERGQTNIGDGSIDFFAYVWEDDFIMERVTDLFLGTDQSDELISYTDEYDKHLKPIQASLEKLGNKAMALEKQKFMEKLEKSRKELQDSKEKAGIDLADAEKKLLDAEKKLLDGEKQLKKIPDKWFVYNREDNPGYTGYGDDAERIGAVAKVFPLFFFLVAALVCLTTMTRMIEEERGEIGTLKALGYGTLTISSKYLLYALLSSLFGTALGLGVGSKLFPTAIMNAYGIMYNIPEQVTPYHIDYSLISILLAVITTVSASLLAALQELRSSPAALIQPKAPSPGKRILLERFSILWSRLSFLQKVTARNIFRYKRRFFMTVIGISGCTALVLTGFGLKNSINDIMDKQFDEILVYDVQVMMDMEKEPQQRNPDIILGENKDTGSYLQTFNESGSAVSDNSNRDYEVSLFIPEDAGLLKNFVSLHERNKKQKVELTTNGAVITEKLSNLLGVKVGDSFEYRDTNNETYDIHISAIVENYFSHYIFMSPKYYKKITGENPEFNSAVLNFAQPDKIDEGDFKDELMRSDGVLGVMMTGSIADKVRDTMESLDYVVLILIISAGTLAFVVLYNLTNINITERIREIATIKVLGFRDREVSAYVYRENMILTVIGTVVGLFLGLWLHKYVIHTMEIDSMMFGQKVHFNSYLLSILLTLVFSGIVNLFMHYKLRNVNMVESLKSIE